MTRTHQNWVRAVLPLGLAVALSCSCRSRTNAPPPVTTEGGASGTAPAASLNAGPLQLPAWRPGARRIYSVHLSAEARLGAQVLTQFDVTGQLAVLPVESSPERLLVHARMLAPRVRSKLTDKAADIEKTARSLEPAVLFELRPGGVISTYHFAPGASQLTASVLESILSALQVRPPQGAPEWQAEEHDSTGCYLAEYRLGQQPGTYQRRKLRYLSLSASGRTSPESQSALMPSIDRSAATLRVTPEGVVESVEIDEAVHSGAGQMVPVASTWKLSLRTASADALASSEWPNWREVLAKGTLVDPAHPWREPINPAQQDSARIAGRSLEQVLSALAALDRAPEPKTEAERKAVQERRGDLFSALAALARSQPGTADRMHAMIKRRHAQTPALLDALGSAGTADAQHVLLELIRSHRLSPEQESHAALSLSRSPRPTPETITGLFGLLGHERLGTQAMLGLGTSVRLLREDGEESRAREIIDAILARLRNARDRMEHVTPLRAIANSGHEAALPVVEPLLESEDELVRAAAVESLQIMRHPRVDGLIAKHLADEHQVVRTAAARATSLRPPSPTLEAAVVSAARTDRDAHVRLAALRILITWAPTRPALRDTIAFVAARDPEETLRKHAAAAK